VDSTSRGKIFVLACSLSDEGIRTRSSYKSGLVLKTSSVVQAIQPECGSGSVLEPDFGFLKRSMSGTPTVKRGRSRARSVLEPGSKDSNDLERDDKIDML